MPSVRFFPLVLVGLLACESSGALSPDEVVTPTEPVDVLIESEDGKNLSGTWQAAPGVEHGPGVLLLHQVDAAEGEGHDRHDWDAVFPELVDAGISVLALDFRSHGMSDPADVPLVELGSDRDQLRFDVEAGLNFLRSQNGSVRSTLRGVAGLGLGASMASVASHESGEGLPGDWGARALVSISARRSRVVDLTAAGDESLSLSNGLFIAGADQELDVQSAEELYEMTDGERRLLAVDGSQEHGVALLDQEIWLSDEIVEWFSLALTPQD